MNKIFLKITGILTITFGILIGIANYKLTGFVIETNPLDKLSLFPGIFLLTGIIIFILGSYNSKTSFEDQLSKKIIGMSYAKAGMTSRLIEDKKILRQKYGLPPRDLMFDDPNEYERKLEKIAKDNEIVIEKKENNIPEGAGGFQKDGKIIIDSGELDEETNYEKRKKKPNLQYLNELTHEITHSLQDKRYPSMPIEIQEYEAYLMSGTEDSKILGNKRIRKGLFQLIQSSVNWNKNNNKK